MAIATGSKVAFAVLGGVLVAGFAMCGGGYLWLQSNSDRLQEQGKAIAKEGGGFGLGKDAPACAAEAVRRLVTLDGVVAEATNKVFLESCLKTARVDAAFCQGVPPRNEILQSATWAIRRCEPLGRKNDSACSRLVGAIQARCLRASPTLPTG